MPNIICVPLELIAEILAAWTDIEQEYPRLDAAMADLVKFAELADDKDTGIAATQESNVLNEAAVLAPPACTPRTDAVCNASYLRRAGGRSLVNVGHDSDAWDFARTLERELNDLRLILQAQPTAVGERR